MRYHDTSHGYLRFIDAFNDAISCGLASKLDECDVKVLSEGGEVYLEIPTKVLEQLINSWALPCLSS